MKLNFTNDRVLAVMAHPDDAELHCAGTLARAKSDGAEIGVCVMCTGDKGLSAGGSPENLAQQRAGEAASAAAILGAELLWFGARDGELFDTYETRRKLIEFYRRFRPTLVIAHWPEDYHPDHRAASAIAETASWFAASPGHVTDSPPLDAPPALWFADALNLSGFAPEFFIDVSDLLDLKHKMLQCHASQIVRGKDRDFARLGGVMLRQCETRGAEAGVKAAEAFRQHHAFKRLRAW